MQMLQLLRVLSIIFTYLAFLNQVQMSFKERRTKPIYLINLKEVSNNRRYKTTDIHKKGFEKEMLD